MSLILSGSSGVTFPDNSTQAVGFYGFKNRIINGGMVIDQRNSGASFTPATGAYLLDRWVYYATQASKFSVQQNAGSVTPPTGFTNYLGMSVSSAVSVGSGDSFSLRQKIEGFNFADLQWGTANAKTVTLSFQVYSSLTGTFGGVLQNSANNRSYPFTYTISSANTWTSASITIAGDTTGTWIGATNGVGVNVIFGLGQGSTFSGTAGSWAGAEYYNATGATSVVGTNGATFYITGVQLEAGSTATSFDYRPYGTELALCQRYCYAYSTTGLSDQSYAISPYSPATYTSLPNSSASMPFYLPVTMRSAPTVSALSGGSAASVNRSTASVNQVTLQWSSTSSGSAYYVTSFIASAEL